jgi:hypothetical protein
MRGSPKVLEILQHRQNSTLWVHAAWIECYWSFLHEVLQRFYAVWRKQHGMWQEHWFLHHDNALSHRLLVVYATIHHWEKHSCHHTTTVLSGCHSEWLSSVTYSDDGPQRDMFWNCGRNQIKSNAMAELLKILKEAFCLCKDHTLKMIRKALPYILSLQCNLKTFWLPIVLLH